MKKCLLIVWVLFATSSLSQAQVRFIYNNIDTISSNNQALINFFSDYIQHRAEGGDPSAFWYPEEPLAFPKLDTYEKWIYALYAYTPATILGLSRIDSAHFKIKTLVETGTSRDSLMIYAIQNFIIRETPLGFKIRDALGYNLLRENYTRINEQYFEFFLPKEFDKETFPIAEINTYVSKIERYFGKPVPFQLRYIYAPDCEALNRLRGYDYVANMMSTKTRVCGLTDVHNRVMYSSQKGVHKHELLRLLNIIFPDAPPVVRNGVTNLLGGAAGKPISYHVKKLAPYVLEHPGVLNDLEAFYYYDDETNPHFVFDALAVNYFIKTRGETALKTYIQRVDLKELGLETFLKQHCGVENVSVFLLEQLGEYSKTGKTLEFVDLF